MLDDLRGRGLRRRARRRDLAALDRLRRPARPRAREVRRQHHVSAATTSRTTATSSRAGWEHLIDIWGADHHGQVKSLQAGMEALGYPAGEPEVLLGQLVKLERGGELGAPVAARREHRHARRHPRRGRSRRRAAHVPAAGHRHHADVRPRRRDRAVDGEPRLLRAVRARADRVDRSPGRGARHRAPADPRREPRAAHARARARPAARARRYPDVLARGGRRSAHRTGSPPGCATSPRRSTASTATAA